MVDEWTNVETKAIGIIQSSDKTKFRKCDTNLCLTIKVTTF